MIENYPTSNLKFIFTLIASIIFLIGVLILVLPGFLNKNSQFKTFLQNISIWVIIIFILFIVMYFFGLV